MSAVAATKLWPHWFPFSSFRLYQEDTLSKIVEAFETKDFVIACMPTGSGKSPLALALAHYFGSAYVCTAQKQLQDQYVKDFAAHLTLLKGKSNYECTFDWTLVQKKRKNSLYPDEPKTCESAPCGLNVKTKQGQAVTDSCKEEGLCPYINQRNAAQGAKVALLNFSNLLAFSAINNDRVFPPRKLLILDECHRIEQELYKYAECHLSRRIVDVCWDQMPTDLQQLFQYPPENLDEGMDFAQRLVVFISKWLKGNQKARQAILEEELVDEGDSSGSGFGLTEDEVSFRKQVAALSKSRDKIKDAIKMHEEGTRFVLKSEMTMFKGTSYRTTVLSPLKVAHLHSLAFRLGSKVLLMSATPGDAATLAASLGIPEDRYVAMEVPYTFTKHENPIWIVPVGSMSRKERDATIPKMARALTVLGRKHAEQKGLVQTYTYDITKKLHELLKHDPRFVWQLTSQDKDSALLRHCTSPEPTILIGPSYKEGVDLKGKLCEWQAIVKFPFGDLGDPIIKARMEESSDWYANLSAVEVTQMLGRPDRSEDDITTQYILDSLFQFFYQRHSSKIAKYIRDRIVVAK